MVFWVCIYLTLHWVDSTYIYDAAVIAGSDTAATALTHIWYFLLRNPTCLSRLRKEVDESFPDGHDIFDFSKQADMPYLNACM